LPCSSLSVSRSRLLRSHSSPTPPSLHCLLILHSLFIVQYTCSPFSSPSHLASLSQRNDPSHSLSLSLSLSHFISPSFYLFFYLNLSSFSPSPCPAPSSLVLPLSPLSPVIYFPYLSPSSFFLVALFLFRSRSPTFSPYPVLSHSLTI
jgi:hypothetical protein